MIRNFLKIISLKNFGKAHVEATMANSIGEIFKSKGELNKALYYYRESLRLETKKNKAFMYNKIANIYFYKMIIKKR